jgi:Na+/melibiose symporter-like transporter
MKIPSWAKSRTGMFWIWVFISSFVAGMFKDLLDLDNPWQYVLFYTICLVIGYVLCWIQHFHRHNELVEKEVKKVFDKKFPHDAFEKEMVNHLREQMKTAVEEKESQRTRHLWN